MLVIKDKRCSGKTTRLIALVKDDPGALLVVRKFQTAREIMKKHTALQGRVVSASYSGLRGTKYKRLYIDDIDYIEPNVLAEIPEYLIAGMSFSTKPEEIYKW